MFTSTTQGHDPYSLGPQVQASKCQYLYPGINLYNDIHMMENRKVHLDSLGSLDILGSAIQL